MPPLCRMLEVSAAKLKPEEQDAKDAKVKEEGTGAVTAQTPSPQKRLATEMEKKMKNFAGDVTLMKAWSCKKL